MKQLFSINFLAFLILSAIFSPLLNFFECYVFDDWQFMQFMIILIVLDSILGIWRAIKRKEVSSKGFGMIFKKLFIYMSLLILSHVLVNFKIEGKPSLIFMWFDDLVYSAILLRESISILENVAIIYPNAVSKLVLEKLKEFELSRKTDHNEG